MRILVVDDEADLREILQFNLENEGYEVDAAASAEEALELLSEEHSIILLDVMMPGMSGYKMAEKLRKEMGNMTPIIFITAKTQENDLLTGFSVGCDDYMTKPFSIKELLVRVKALIKRTESQVKNGGVNTGTKLFDLIVDKDNMTASIADQELILTKKEFDILSLLITYPGKYLTREDILNSVWGSNVYVSERTIDVHITNLRKKLSISQVTINSRINYGYTLEEK